MKTDTKTYVLTVSRNFPTTHPRKGEKTEFVLKIQNGLGITCKNCREVSRFDGDCCGYLPGQKGEKLHTIRANYDFWKKRIDEVNEGKAILSLRYWTGKPYCSKQEEFARLDKDSGIGVQKLEDPTNFVFAPIDGKTINWDEVAKNDGLSFNDFCEWFKVRKNSPMAIIHFTNFRY